MSRAGWFKESHRHSLAARGITTNRYMARSSRRSAFGSANIADSAFDFRRDNLSLASRQKRSAKLSAQARVAKMRATKPATDQEIIDRTTAASERFRARQKWQVWVDTNQESLLDGLKARKAELANKQFVAIRLDPNSRESRQFDVELEALDDAFEKVRSGAPATIGADGFTAKEANHLRATVDRADAYGSYISEDEILIRVAKRFGTTPEALKKRGFDPANPKSFSKGFGDDYEPASHSPSMPSGPGDAGDAGGAGVKVTAANATLSEGGLNNSEMLGFMTKDAQVKSQSQNAKDTSGGNFFRENEDAAILDKADDFVTSKDIESFFERRVGGSVVNRDRIEANRRPIDDSLTTEAFRRARELRAKNANKSSTGEATRETPDVIKIVGEDPGGVLPIKDHKRTKKTMSDADFDKLRKDFENNPEVKEQ